MSEVQTSVEGEVVILPPTNENVNVAPQKSIMLVASITQRGLTYKGEGGEEMDCSPSVIKRIEAKSSGTIPNVVGLTNKFVGEFRSFLGQIKGNKGIKASSGFMVTFEVEFLENDEVSRTEVRGTTFLKVSDPRDMAKAVSLFIAGADDNANYVEGVSQGNELQKQLFIRLFGNDRGTALVHQLPNVQVAQLALHTKAKKADSKLIVSDIKADIFAKSPGLQRIEREKLERSLGKLEIEMLGVDGKIQDLQADIEAGGVDNEGAARGARAALKIELEKLISKKAKAELALESLKVGALN